MMIILNSPCNAVRKLMISCTLFPWAIISADLMAMICSPILPDSVLKTVILLESTRDAA